MQIWKYGIKCGYLIILNFIHFSSLNVSKKFLNKLEKANAYLKLSFKGKLPFFCYKLDVIHIKMININITQDSLWTYQQNQLIILISVHVLFQCVVVSC